MVKPHVKGERGAMQFGTVLASAGTIAFFSLVSRALGLLRDRLLAGQYGAGLELDAYFAAFKVPDFLYNLLVLGALTAAFVPVVGGLLAKKQEREANQTTSAILNIIVVTIAVLAVVAEFFVPQLVSLTAPGFVGAGRDLTIQLTRIMLISPVLFGLSSVISSYLNTRRRFTAYALAPVAYNVGLILGIVVLVPLFGPTGLAWGVLLGALLHIFAQVPSFFKAGFRYSPLAAWRRESVGKILRLAGPRLISVGAQQISLVVITAVATLMSSGTVTAYNLAFNLQSLSLGIVGISLATAVFPLLAEAASRNRGSEFIGHVTQTVRQIMFLIIPLSLAFILLRVEIVRLVLGTGSFDFQDTFETAAALGVFSISLFAQSVVPVLARAFYSLEDTKTPVAISVTAVIINVVASFTLARTMGIFGLALGFTIAAVIDFLLHAIFLRGRLGSLDDKEVFMSVFRTLTAAAIGGIGLLAVRSMLLNIISLNSFGAVLLLTIGALLVGGILYVATHALLRSPELKDIWRMFSAKIRRS